MYSLHISVAILTENLFTSFLYRTADKLVGNDFYSLHITADNLAGNLFTSFPPRKYDKLVVTVNILIRTADCLVANPVYFLLRAADNLLKNPIYILLGTILNLVETPIYLLQKAHKLPGTCLLYILKCTLIWLGTFSYYLKQKGRHSKT